MNSHLDSEGAIHGSHMFRMDPKLIPADASMDFLCIAMGWFAEVPTRPIMDFM